MDAYNMAKSSLVSRFIDATTRDPHESSLEESDFNEKI